MHDSPGVSCRRQTGPELLWCGQGDCRVSPSMSLSEQSWPAVQQQLQLAWQLQQGQLLLLLAKPMHDQFLGTSLTWQQRPDGQ